MSLLFKSRGRTGGKMSDGKSRAKADPFSGYGQPGMFINFEKSHSFIPDDEFCALILYFLTNYDLRQQDPRLPLIKKIKELKKKKGFNGSKSRRLDF